MSTLPQLQVDTVRVNGKLVLRVRGEVNLNNAPRLRELLLRMAQHEAGPVRVDLSDVAYMDSSGVGTLVYVKRRLEKDHRTLVLVGLQPRVRSLLEITHLADFFNIADAADESPPS